MPDWLRAWILLALAVILPVVVIVVLGAYTNLLVYVDLPVIVPLAR